MEQPNFTPFQLSLLAIAADTTAKLYHASPNYDKYDKQAVAAMDAIAEVMRPYLDY